MLLFDVENQVITRRDRFSPATDSVKYLKAKFNFKTDDWSDKSKTAVFTVFDKKYPAVVDSNNVCVIPWEALAYTVENNYRFAVDNYIYVSVVGIKGDIRITTDKVKILLNLSGYGEWENTSEPTPDVYTQYVNMIKAEAEAVAQALDDVEAINEEIKNSYSNAFKGLKSGAVVRVDDVSPIEHNPIVKVRGINLLNPVGKSKTENGITFTNNADGTFTVKGTSTGSLAIDLTDITRYPIYLKKGKTYTQSVEITEGEGATHHIVPSVIDDMGIVTYNYFNGNQTKTPDTDYRIKSYSFYIASNVTVDFTFRVQLEEGDVATEYVPYVDPATVTVTRYGADETDNPITYTTNEDGSVDGVKSLSPTMTLLTDNADVTIEIEYNRDTNKVIDDLKNDIIGGLDTISALVGGAE